MGLTRTSLPFPFTVRDVLRSRRCAQVIREDPSADVERLSVIPSQSAPGRELGRRVSPLHSCRQSDAASTHAALLLSSPHTYKIPPRLVLHETKKQAYIADLANPAVPLQKLSRSIPHGFKGVDLLEMLANNDVSFDRALWFIKVCGGSELVRSYGLAISCSSSTLITLVVS